MQPKPQAHTASSANVDRLTDTASPPDLPPVVPVTKLVRAFVVKSVLILMQQHTSTFAKCLLLLLALQSQ